ncbi:hypothetical protein MKW92_018685 [Papaver armeniacum]|nr:hypothetical protein MKW92_018685 [Papaver armeniacum]
MRAPNYILEEDPALVTAYINFGGDGAVGVQQKKKENYGGRSYLISMKKRKIRIIVYRKKGSGWSPEDLTHQARIEYTRIYRKAFPYEEVYKLFKYVKHFHLCPVPRPNMCT